jgi:hypothetical protein
MCRVYLSPELNIRKLWRMYNDQCQESDLKVKESFFRNQVNLRYNIGFGTPAKDACTQCLRIEPRLKLATSEAHISELRLQLRTHKNRAAEFYEKLREVRNGLRIISFDCQKNMPLPKLPDQAAYYSRQLSCYNLGIDAQRRAAIAPSRRPPSALHSNSMERFLGVISKSIENWGKV